MKVSIIIPQLFYDLIARILPGFFFISLILIFIPDIHRHIDLIIVNNNSNFIESIGSGIYYLVLSYFLGWMFRAFTFSQKKKKKDTPKAKGDILEVNKKEKPKTNKIGVKRQYQWIRLNNPQAGFRIVKLRAEARMLASTRTAMVLFLLILLASAILDFLSSNLNSLNILDTKMIKYLVGLICSIIVYIGCYKQEAKVWDNYLGNIKSIYKILHDKDDPINEVNKKHPARTLSRKRFRTWL